MLANIATSEEKLLINSMVISNLRNTKNAKAEYAAFPQWEMPLAVCGELGTLSLIKVKNLNSG